MEFANSQFKQLRNRLFLSYVGVIAGILALFSTAVYQVVAYDRNQQLNAHLRQLADAAADILEIVQHEYQELKTDQDYQGYLPPDAEGMPFPISLSQLMGKYQANSILEVPNEPVPSSHQEVVWYNNQQQVMIREGNLVPTVSLPRSLSQLGKIVQTDTVRSLMLPVYRHSSSNRPQLIGYIRASESTLALDAELRRLQWGLGLGGLIIVGLTALGGIWLTQESLKPIVLSFEQLRQFTADASHELRNPLTAIRASIAVIQSHPERVHPQDIEKLAAIASASEQMSELVNDLLLLARLDRQALEQPIWRAIALDELLEDTIDLFADTATGKGITLTAQITPDLTVMGEGSQLQRLFTNLLANALQYTSSGGWVTVTLEKQGDRILVTIADTGIGIAPEHLPYIFDRFWRADHAPSQHTNGTGLGLAIAQAITQQHRGEILVRSQLGMGSQFQVKLPLFHDSEPRKSIIAKPL